MVRLGIIGAGIMGERLLRAAQGHASVAVSGAWDPRGPPHWPGCGTLAPADLPRPQAVIAGVRLRLRRRAPGQPPRATHARRSPPARPCSARSRWRTDVADARAFLAEAASARAAVNFPFASSPSVERLGSWLAGMGHAGTVGDRGRLRHLAARLAAGRRRAGWTAPAQGGFTREVVSHFLFLARRLLGPLSPASPRPYSSRSLGAASDASRHSCRPARCLSG